MRASEGRLLVSLPPDPDLRRWLKEGLGDVPYTFVSSSSRGPWARAEALLTGAPARELPHWEPRQAPNLSFVQSLFAGVDDFPFQKFPAPIRVAGNSGAYAPFVAEHTIAMVLALAKNLRNSFDLVRGGRLRSLPPTVNLIGKTALILGFGGIGQEVAHRLRGFGMRVEAVSRSGADRPGADRTYSADSLLRALGSADVIIEARPLTNATRSTLGSAAFGQMKRSAIFVNVGRAGTVDEDALYHHLVRTPTFRAGTDVWWSEDWEHNRFWDRRGLARLPNFLATPHTAGFTPGMTAEARARVFGLAIENLSRFFAEGAPRFVIDRSEYS